MLIRNERYGPIACPRLILQSAATIGVAALLSAAAPVLAAEKAVPTRETTAKLAPSKIKHHASRVRLAAAHDHRRAAAIPGDLGCTGSWCGRQFVLMIGIGY